MNNASNLTTAELAEIITQEVYENYVYNIAHYSGITLVIYVILLRFSQEREHIWFKRFNLPSLLYLFTRYGYLVSLGFEIGLNFLPVPGTTCNIFADVTNAASLISYTGIQGLLIARTYALCSGNKFIATSLALIFISEFALYLFGDIAFNGCITSLSSETHLIGLISDIMTVITDLIVFAVCIWKIWSIWKLKREIGIQGNDLTSILLQQSILRCCFVAVVTITQAIVVQFLSVAIASTLTTFQQVLSAILVADFTLDLRERNSARIDSANITLPTLQFRSVLQHIHQSFLVETGAPDEPRPEDPANADSEETQYTTADI